MHSVRKRREQLLEKGVMQSGERMFVADGAGRKAVQNGGNELVMSMAFVAKQWTLQTEIWAASPMSKSMKPTAGRRPWIKVWVHGRLFAVYRYPSRYAASLD
jgi:hypothetical protein